MSKNKVNFDHGKMLPFVWIAILISVVFIIFSLASFFTTDLNTVPLKDFILLMVILVFPTMILIFLYGYYLEHFFGGKRMQNSTNLSLIATFSLVLNYFWLYVILMSLKDALFSLNYIEFTVLAKSLLMLIAILPNVIFITSLYKKDVQSSDDLIGLKKISLKIKLLVVSNIFMVQLACIYMIIGADYWYRFNDNGLFTGFSIAVGAVTLWTVLRRNRQLNLIQPSIVPIVIKWLVFSLAIYLAYWCFDRYTAYQEVQELKERTLAQMVFVEGGSFMMGDAEYLDEYGEKRYVSTGSTYSLSPPYKVTLTHYSISAFETTFRDYDAYTHHMGKGKTWAEYRDVTFRRNPESYRYTQMHPAKGINWYEAREYCQWLGEAIGYPMDLPSEAQWEFAARSRGLAVAYATNNGKREFGVNIAESNDEMPVGSWPPNPLGIYDMAGNQHEWLIDTKHSRPTVPLINPVYDEDDKDTQYPSQRIVRTFKIFRGYSRPPEQRSAGIRCVANFPEPLSKLVVQ